MRDAFKNELKVGDKVLYSTENGVTCYRIGVVTKLFEETVYSPAKVGVDVETTSNEYITHRYSACVYACNVVRIASLRRTDVRRIRTKTRKNKLSERLRAALACPAAKRRGSKQARA